MGAKFFFLSKPKMSTHHTTPKYEEKTYLLVGIISGVIATLGVTTLVDMLLLLMKYRGHCFRKSDIHLVVHTVKNLEKLLKDKPFYGRGKDLDDIVKSAVQQQTAVDWPKWLTGSLFELSASRERLLSNLEVHELSTIERKQYLDTYEASLAALLRIRKERNTWLRRVGRLVSSVMSWRPWRS